MSASFKDSIDLPTREKTEAEAKKRAEELTAAQAAIIRAPVFQAPDVLSRREREVCNLIATGVSNKEAAVLLFVEVKTIKFHLTNIFKKLGLKSRSQLIVHEVNRKAALRADSEI